MKNLIKYSSSLLSTFLNAFSIHLKSSCDLCQIYAIENFVLFSFVFNNSKISLSKSYSDTHSPRISGKLIF